MSITLLILIYLGNDSQNPKNSSNEETNSATNETNTESPHPKNKPKIVNKGIK